MRDKFFILISIALLYTLIVSGQCLDRDSLWKKLASLSELSGISPTAELQLLLAEQDKLKNCPDRNDSSYAFLLRKIGMCYFRLYDYLKAVKYFRYSIDLVTENTGNPGINPKHLIPAYYRLAVIYDSLNSVNERMAALDSCFTLSVRFNSVDLLGLAALYKRVEYFYDVGDYHHCIDYATQCERLAEKYAKQGRREYEIGFEYASSSLAWQVNALLMLKDYDKVEKLLTIKVATGENAEFKFNQGTLHAQLAQLEEHKGNYEKALTYLDQAFNYDKEMDDELICKSILNMIGYEIYFKHYKDADRAMNYYQRALVFGNKNRLIIKSDSIELLNILANIAGAFVSKGMFDSAFRYFQLAFDQTGPGANESVILKSSLDEFSRQKKIGYLTNLFIDKGDAYFQLYKMTRERRYAEQCIHIYKMADNLMDKIKSEQVDLESKLFWRADSRRLYEHAIEACNGYNNVLDAFYFFEKSRAVLLNDQLKEQRWLGTAEIQRQTQSKRRILQIKRELLDAKKADPHFDELRDQLFNEQQQLNHLVQIIKGQNPLYYQSFLDTALISIQDVQKRILMNHQALVEIFEGDSAVYSLIINKNSANLSRINKSLYDSLSKVYLSLIANSSINNRFFSSFVINSRKLYQLIFGNKVLPAGRIVISPDGQYFPFESLVNSKENFPVHYLLYDCAITYTYSARYMMNDFKTDKTGDGFFGMAPVNYPLDMQLASLTGSDLSLARLRNYFSGGTCLCLKEASKANFLSQFYKYKVIQLYAHASNTGVNGEPVIYFSDSSMNLSDLLIENKPMANLVVLSACETGTGKEYKGEGVFSFNRAFAALGIPASITNLWTVENESIYKLTENFYKHLAEGKPSDIALQEAKIEFMNTTTKEKQLPYYWAAPILVGTDATVDVHTGVSWNAIFIVTIFLLLTGLLLYRKISARGKAGF